MAKKTFETKKFGEVIVRNAMLELDDNTTLVDGIEIKGDDIDLIEIYQYKDVEELSLKEVENLIEKYQ